MTSSRKKIGPSQGNNFIDGPDSGPAETDPFEKLRSASNDFFLIGKLTPEVVHDINNFLTGILGYAELLSMKPGQDQGLKKGLQNIYISAEKCKELLSNLIGLVRQERSLPAQININEAVEKTLLLRNCALRHKQILVTKSLGNNLPGIPTKDSKLEKALLVLIFQAEEVLGKLEKGKKINFETALDDSGTLLIRLDILGAEGVDSTLLKRQEAAIDPPNESLFGVGLKEAEDWIGAMGGSLKLEEMAEEGFSFVIRFPLKG